MTDANGIMWKARTALGRDLEADELHMIGRLLKANEDDDQKGEDWYVHELLELIDEDRQDVPDEHLATRAYWVEPKQIVEIE